MCYSTQFIFSVLARKQGDEGDVSVEQDIQAPGLQEASKRVGGVDAKISLMPQALFIWKQL